MNRLENRDSDAVVPAAAIIDAWPRLRPHVREAIVTLIDADLIQSRLQNDAFTESTEQLEIDSAVEVYQP